MIYLMYTHSADCNVANATNDIVKPSLLRLNDLLYLHHDPRH